MKKKIIAVLLACVIGFSGIVVSAKRAEASATVAVVGGYAVYEIILALLAAMGITFAADEVINSSGEYGIDFSNYDNLARKIFDDQLESADIIQFPSPAPTPTPTPSGEIVGYTSALELIKGKVDVNGVIPTNDYYVQKVFTSLSKAVSYLTRMGGKVPSNAIYNDEINESLNMYANQFLSPDLYPCSCLNMITVGSTSRLTLTQSQLILYYSDSAGNVTGYIPEGIEHVVFDFDYMGNKQWSLTNKYASTDEYFVSDPDFDQYVFPSVFQARQYYNLFMNYLDRANIYTITDFLQTSYDTPIPGINSLSPHYTEALFAGKKSTTYQFVPNKEQFNYYQNNGDYDYSRYLNNYTEGIAMPYQDELLQLSKQAYENQLRQIHIYQNNNTLTYGNIQSATSPYPVLSTDASSELQQEYAESLNSSISSTQDKMQNITQTETGSQSGNGVRPDEETAKEANCYTADWTGLFPFCIPFDLIDMLKAMQSNRVAPVIEIPVKFHFGNTVNYDHTFTVDFDEYSEFIEIFRVLQIVGFSVGLILITRQIIKG